MNISKIKRIFQLSKKAFKKYKWQVVILTVLGFLSGLLEGIGVNTLIPLFTFLTNGSNKDFDFISRYINKLFLYFNVDFSVKFILIFICLLFIAKAITVLLFNYIKILISTSFEEEVRNKLFKNTLFAKYPFLAIQKTGYLENRIVNDVRISANMFQQISGVIMLGTGLIIYILVALNISTTITLITLLLGGFLLLFFRPVVKRIKVTATKVVGLNKEIANFINEYMLGIKVIKALHVSEQISKIGEKHFYKLKKYKIRLSILKSFSNSMMQPFSLIFICVVFAVAYKMPNFQFASLVAVVYLIQRIFQYIQNLQSSINTINESLPYIKSILNYNDEIIAKKEENKGENVFETFDKIRFENVCFSYDKSTSVLDDVSFSVGRGEMIGIIGPSGSGKTTILDLFIRLLSPNSGKIIIDGEDANSFDLEMWRNKIGYVSQDNFLINDTITNNIKFFSDNIDAKQVKIISRQVGVNDFVENNKKKYDALAGEGGRSLSGGQRQRIIIARILARQPDILLFDEATSSLDNESEKKIQNILNYYKNKMTIVVVAHRLSTVKNCDRLVVVENGNVLESGSPEELLKDKGSYYYKMFNIKR